MLHLALVLNYSGPEMTPQEKDSGDRALTPPNQNMKEAMSLTVDITKQEITLAMAAIVFSGTLLKVQGLTHHLWLPLSWGAWTLSLLLGLFAMGRVTTLTSEGHYAPFDFWLMCMGMGQQLLLVAGVILFAIFVIYR